MISKEKKNTLHIASCSFGKDSLATILLALEHGEPLDEAVYCEVMFDKRTSGEVPEHRAFIYETALPRLERLGIPVHVLRSDKTYLDLFAGVITRGPKKGLRRGFPLCGHCYVQRDCKLRPIRLYNRTLTPDTVQYVGIASDEPVRSSLSRTLLPLPVDPPNRMWGGVILVKRLPAGQGFLVDGDARPRRGMGPPFQNTPDPQARQYQRHQQPAPAAGCGPLAAFLFLFHMFLPLFCS